MSDEEDDPKFVAEEICDARMMALESKFRYLYIGTLITIVLIIVQIVRGT